MGIEICAVGGYGEVGKNMTAIRVDDEVVICDLGIHLPNWIRFTEHDEGEVVRYSRKKLIDEGAIPDDSIINDWRAKVVALVPSHAHLDHVGAVPFLARRYECPIFGSPFTMEVLKTILHDERIVLPNELKTVLVGSRVRISQKIELEFIHMTHSTPQTTMIVLHTPYGGVLYGCDFKIDDSPTLGPKPDYAALERAGKQGLACAMVDSLYADHKGKTPSEAYAKELLREVMFGENFRGHGLIVTTFSSHIARLASIVEFAKKLKRKPIFLGRSLSKYTTAAQEAGLIKFDDVEIVKYGRKVRRRLREIERQKGEYLICMTGHQGEPNAVLSRIADGKLRFHFDKGDAVLFSCHVIPAEINRQNRQVLEKKLADQGVRMYRDLHVSGHGRQDDIRQLVSLCKPKMLIPMHSEPPMMDAFCEVSKQMGYKIGETLFPVRNGDRLKIV
ncbi:RNase J family beta-CASP ribonuclease [Candidatus Woesearchaeota archaeon]|nr:RNase J family beta-CASP ribonuclease [Candidatus Woesearchaeota archaeon]